MGGVNGVVEIWERTIRHGEGDCVGFPWLVKGDLWCGLMESCHQGRKRGNGRLWRGGYVMDGMSEGL